MKGACADMLGLTCEGLHKTGHDSVRAQDTTAHIQEPAGAFEEAAITSLVNNLLIR